MNPRPSTASFLCVVFFKFFYLSFACILSGTVVAQFKLLHSALQHRQAQLSQTPFSCQFRLVSTLDLPPTLAILFFLFHLFPVRQYCQPPDHLSVNTFSQPQPFHSQDLSISNFPCKLTRNITSHSMENLAFHSFLSKDEYTTMNSHCLTHTFLFRKVRRMYLFNLGVKGLNKEKMYKWGSENWLYNHLSSE